MFKKIQTYRLTSICNLRYLLTPLFLFLFLLCSNKTLHAQANFGSRQVRVINFSAFGAIPNDNIDDSYAMIKMARFVENRWRANGDTIPTGDTLNINYNTHYLRIEIPSGTYNVGKEIDLTTAPYDSLWYCGNAAIPDKKVRYSDLYGDTANNNDGIIAHAAINTCLQKYVTRSYYAPELFYVHPYYTPNNLIDGIEFIGTGVTKPVFKFADNIHVGFMDTLGNAVNYEFCGNADFLFHTPLNLFRFNLSKNISFENIEINGNNQQILYKGGNADGIQNGPCGIVLDAKNVTLKDLYVHHLGFDGIMLRDRACTTRTNLVAENIVSEYNRRQGFSWSTGDSLYFNNCKFNHSGQAISIAQAGAIISSGPASGIDIEYETGWCEGVVPQYAIKNGWFVNCEFINNRGKCVENNYDNAGDATVKAKNVLFKKCTMHDVDDYGVWVRGRNFEFDSCNIYAAVIHGYLGDSLNGEPKYKNCHFEDLPYNGTHLPNWYKLFHFDGVKKALFQNCTFKINDSAREFMWLNWDVNLPKDKWITIDNCSFTYNSDGKPYPYPSKIANVKFKGKNIIKNTLNSINSHHNITTRKCELEGSNDPCNPNTLTFEGQVEHHMTSNTDTFRIGYKENGGIGFADYFINDKALLLKEGTTDIVIGDESRMLIDRGGSFTDLNIGAGKLYPYGHFIAKNNSYINVQGIQFHTTGWTNGDKLVYIDKGVNKNSTTLSPLWSNGVGYGTGVGWDIYNPTWLGNYNGGANAPCIHGGNPILTNWACNAPLYQNIETGKSMSIMYNKSVSCFGNANANNTFRFTVKGGTGNYTCTLYSAPPMVINPDQTYTNYSIGTYSLSVTDNNTNCIDTFIVKVDTTFEYNIIKGCVSGATPAQFSTNACSNPTVSGPGTATFSGNVCSVSAAGTYTVTATSPTGNVSKTIYIGDCTNCSTAPNNAEWITANTASSTISPNGILENKPIVLQGTIPVDNEWFLYNNNQIYLTPNTMLDVQNNQALVINKSKLQGCTNYWIGIFADNDGERVIINNGSTLKDMNFGVQIENNAFIQAKNSTYLNNIISIGIADNMHPSLESFIWGNTFKGDATMFPNADGNKPNVGIVLSYIGNFNIGELNDANSKNEFENMITGIYIKNYVNGVADSKIGIYNCKFKNIGYSDYAINKLNQCYYTPKGAAVYCNIGPSPAMERSIDIRNHSNYANTLMYKNCDKMIVNSGATLRAEGLKADSCFLGIMSSFTEGRKVNVENNNLQNVFTGVQSNGNCGSSKIQGNTVRVTHSAINSPYWIGWIWGEGITVNKILNTGSDTFLVKNNTVELNSYGGAGISLYNTNKHTSVSENYVIIHPSSTQMTPDSSPHNILFGIGGVNMEKTAIYKNNINGNDSLNNSGRENAYGILINHSYNHKVECNTMQKTRFGVGAISECLTDTSSIRGNTVFDPVLGWVFRHLGTEGSFGDVGTTKYDNHNIWAGNNTLYKVFKFCEGQDPYAIFTNPSFLIQNESNSYNIVNQQLNDCAYFVDVNTGNYTTYNCPILPNYMIPPSSGGFTHAQAISIATDTKSYTEYPEISRWFDRKRLYEQLEADTTYTNSNDTLLNFYTDMQNDMIEHIESTDTKLAELIASMQSQNYEQYIQRINEASSNNSNIPDTTVQGNNENRVNAIYIKLLAYGIDSLNATDSTNLAEIATLCPYIGGSAVYKARGLYALYEPALMYDDITICNNVGVYKNGNGKGLFDDENTYLQSLKPKEAALAKFVETKFMLYPNPASTNITIAYELNQNENGNVIIYDMLGREQMKIDLSNSNNKVSINVSLLRRGMYTYKYLVNNRTRTTGKLLIE